MKSKIGSILLLCCTILVSQEINAQVAPIKEYTIYKTLTPIVVDGVLDEADWIEAPVTDNLLNMDGSTSGLVTNAKMLWSDTHLYFAFTVQDNSMWATLATRDAALWNQDVMEVLIDKDGDAVDYTEMGFSPNENLYDLVMSKPYSAGGTYNSGWNITGLTVQTTITGTLNTATGGVQWVCEVALPFSGLPASPVTLIKPNVGDVWRLNIARADHDYNNANNLRLYTWTYTDGVTNHLPSRFGRVTFGDVIISTGIQQGLAEGISVYPNPASNQVFITSQTDLSGATIKVLDLVGREVVSETGYKAELDIAGLEAGVYTLIIKKDDDLFIKKLVVD